MSFLQVPELSDWLQLDEYASVEVLKAVLDKVRRTHRSAQPAAAAVDLDYHSGSSVRPAVFMPGSSMSQAAQHSNPNRPSNWAQ